LHALAHPGIEPSPERVAIRVLAELSYAKAEFVSHHCQENILCFIGLGWSCGIAEHCEELELRTLPT
jgi:hypothetical protein